MEERRKLAMKGVIKVTITWKIKSPAVKANKKVQGRGKGRGQLSTVFIM